MTLDDTLALLRRHAARPLDAAEAAMLAEYAPFITTHADCLLRTCVPGHLTASAWIVDCTRRWTLLTHHHKLDRWLQLGGHVDGEPDLLAAALREGREESGLRSLAPVSPEIFDVDRHVIPARGAEPEHWHYDVRFLIEADREEPLQISDESKDLAWVELDLVAELNPSESLARMVRKTERRS
ncbi:MAG: NUDIX hydrolase [Opitutae bacterium]|nr:NUDIX hydrolase [Opitutae bacterium]